MRPKYEYGESVRVTRNVRNDGTFPGLETGALLVRRGSVGFVKDVGTFLQDQIIYSVHFMQQDRMVGCREEELQPEDAPWVPSRFEFREKVRAKNPFAVQGEVIVAAGAEGEILKVLRDGADGVAYHVRFPGRTLQIPEQSLSPAEQAEAPETEEAP